MMKKLMSIIFVCVFSAVLFAGCTSKESTQTSNQSEVQEQTKESTQTPSQSEVQEPISHQKNTAGISSSLPYASLGLNVLCVFGIVWCFRKIEYLRWKIQKKEDLSSKHSNRHAQVQTPPANMRMEIDNALKGYKLPSYEVERIVDEVLKRMNIQHTEPQINISTQSQNNADTPVNSMPTAKKKLYASQWNINNNSFYNVCENPNDNTVYELEVNGNRAEFGLFNGAITKVIAAPDFLTHASDVQQIKQDPDKARTEIKGRAILNNGNWNIEIKARIIFE